MPAWMKCCAIGEAGLHGFGAHGLRKASMTRFAETGCSVHEIAAFSGHRTLAEIAHYTRSVEQAALADTAMAKTRTKLSKPVGYFLIDRGKKPSEVPLQVSAFNKFNSLAVKRSLASALMHKDISAQCQKLNWELEG